MSRSPDASDLQLLLRRHLRFGLKTFFVVVSALAIFIGLKAGSARRQERAVEFIEQRGGQFRYDYETLDVGSPIPGRNRVESDPTVPGPAWLHGVLSKHYFITPIRLSMADGRMIPAEVVERLPDLSSLEHLYLRQSTLTDATLRSLPVLNRLISLSVEPSIVASENEIVQDYSFLSKFPNLEELSLRFSAFSDEDAVHVVNGSALCRLYLRDTALGDKGLRDLNLRDIVRLDLDRTNVTDAGLAYLSSMTELKFLSLNGTAITDRGLENLSSIPKLRSLLLINTSISDEGLKHLTNISSLRRLDLISTDVSESGINMIHEALPNCHIQAEWGRSIGRWTRD